MARNNRSLVIGISLLAGVAFGVIVPRLFGGNDSALIKQALKDSIKAGKEGKPGGVLDLLSNNFKINQEMPGGREIAQYIRQYKPDFEVAEQKPIVTGETAVMISPVKVSSNLLGQEIKVDLKNVTMRFKKEDAFQYFIIPSRKWKLTEVQVPAESWSEAVGLSMFGG